MKVGIISVMNATIQTETLTDGSVVYNVIRNGEQVANPASINEAIEICNRLNAPSFEALISHWLIQGKYRTVQHRHDGSYRAIDQASGDEWRSETLAGLVELMTAPQKPVAPKVSWECKTCGFKGEYCISEVFNEHARFNGEDQKYCPNSPVRL